MAIETFFLGRVDQPPPARPAELTAVESTSLMELRWLSWEELGAVPEPIEPASLDEVLTRLDPAGPWNPERP